MSIASVFPYPLSVAQPVCSGRVGMMSSLVVEVTTRDGRSGFGEAYSPIAPRAAADAVVDAMTPLLVGEDEGMVSRLWDMMRRTAGKRPTPALAEAMSAIDIALWDLLGQSLGVPIATLIGGMSRTVVPAYASFVGWISDDGAIAVAKGAVAAGFRQIKVKLSPTLDAAMARTRLMREVVGEGVSLVADPNGCFDEVEATRLAHHLAALGYGWLEEPLDPANLEGLARLNAQSILTIAAGENECDLEGAARLMTAGAIGLFQPDCGRIGGITGLLRAAHTADALGIPVAPHHAGGPVKAAASLHLAAALQGIQVIECSLLRTPLHDTLTRHPVAHPDLLDRDGMMPVPDGPGLGIAVDRDALRSLAIH